MSLPKDANEFNIIDDNFWDEFNDDSTTFSDTNGASSTSNRGGALAIPETHTKYNKATADDSKKTTAGSENRTDDNLFVATGLCAEDLQNCFDDDFDECANQSEPKKEERNRRSCSDPGANILPEIPSDMFDDDSVGWLAEEPEVVPRKRKFPGPAGILPKSRSSLSFSGSGMTTGEANSRKPEPPDDLLCTPWSAEADNPLSPWQHLRQDLGIEDLKDSNLNEYSIAWVLKMKRLQQLPRGKVPVLCTSIKNVAKNILTLRDGTGEILATIDKSCQDYKPCLKAGAAFILVKASVYVNDHGQHCLVLTKQNIVQIYSCAEDGASDVIRIDVNPMTLQDLEGICAQLEREALEDAAKHESRGCGSPYLDSRAKNFSPVPHGAKNGRAQWTQGRDSASPGLFSNKGNAGAPLQPRNVGAGSGRTWIAARGAARTSHSPTTSARLVVAQGGGTKRPNVWLKEDVSNLDGPLTSPCPPKVPAYKPPVRPSAASSGPKPSCDMSSVISLLKSSAASKSQVTSQSALNNTTPTKCVVNNGTSTSVNATAGASNLLLPNDNDTSMEELQWLEDDADDIFQTIDDVCLV
ncbi:hypothetical protein HPB49_009061 [Dermacentor silvarum]|uniref:Uncharacterized protein n=1 Tax=Dermacentor silvarum TaxID=543639 RepID=A0ACB8DC07_DERSI|nr:uncharacterized protein LOC119443064 [Dermacentor silvarum]KAH7965637.1 hypothetical protein HPB49_009061 [Dermacentor silvarum]